MREIWRRGVFGLTALFLVGALSSIGQAFPGKDTGDCTSCHNNDGLDYEATPNLLTIAPGGDGQIDFGIALSRSELCGPDRPRPEGKGRGSGGLKTAA